MPLDFEPSISVCLPSRGRPKILRRGLDSLRDNAEHPDKIEYLVAIDPDDTIPVIDYASFYVTPQRYGYSQLHRYYNELAMRATGSWILCWNDEMVMHTPGWDKAAKAPASVIFGGNCAPFIHRTWVHAMGRVGSHYALDWWTQHLGQALGRLEIVPWLASHDKVDDITNLEGFVRSDIETYHTEEMKAERRADLLAIMKLLGQDDLPDKVAARDYFGL